MPASKFSIYWDAQNSDKYTGVPILQKTRNDLDAHGTFLGLERLPAEANDSYYRRLQSVLPLRGGANHEGLVHGVTRDLGLFEYIGIRISPVSSSGVWSAPSPYVEITASSIILYSSYTDANTNTIDKTINIFDHGSGYLLEDVITEIQSSEFFLAELGPSMTGGEKANGLFPGSSSTVVNKEWIPANNYFALENPDVIPYTLYFTEKDVFTTELSDHLATLPDNGMSFSWAVSTTVTQMGEYFVDYKNGIVTAYKSASGRGTCRYIYRNFPWDVRWSPVVVYSLRDEVYKDQIFEDESMPNDLVEDGLATAEGVEVYTQLFERSPSLWGE
jgi:hypothetical protein